MEKYEINNKTEINNETFGITSEKVVCDQYNLEKIEYNDDTISFKDINMFEVEDKNRMDNDKNNKKRENIIGCIINNKIPTQYFEYSNKWLKLKEEIDKFIKIFCKKNQINKVDDIKCINKAGRRYNYDFQFVINNCQFKIEFKFNAQSINQTPQFVSPMKPSQYLEGSYEEYYYDNYFQTFANKYNLTIPSKEDYLSNIHNTDPLSLKEYKKKYYKGCEKSSKFSGEENDIEFYNEAKKISNESISNFISKYSLKRDKLSEYLINTQKNKYYMLYKNGNIYLDTINLDNYIILEVQKEPTKFRYLAKTETGKILKILLRWKNGSGIAYPAFQIS